MWKCINVEDDYSMTKFYELNCYDKKAIDKESP